MAATCEVEDCTRSAKGRRPWCAMHIERWRRWGDPTETHPRVRQLCLVDDCDDLSEARGMCNSHYGKWRRRQSAPRPRARLSLADRIGRNIDRSGGPDACWPWTGSRSPRGYGRTSIVRDGRNVNVGAHRAAYIAVHGDLPPEVFVLHGCHNPPCCNPAHLRAGTHLENMIDRKTEGAGYPRGAEHPRGLQISDEDVQAIRSEYRPRVKGRDQHALAARFGISRSEIQRILTRTDRWSESA